MADKNNDALCYTCRLIEYIGRKTKQERKNIVKMLGVNFLKEIYSSAKYHVEPVEMAAEKIIFKYNIKEGTFDNVADCIYEIPDYQVMGEVYERLIEDVASNDNIIEKLMEVYTSWMDRFLSDYNIAVYDQSREYIAACYREGTILE